jgi:hypothetical protein
LWSRCGSGWLWDNPSYIYMAPYIYVHII